MATKKEIADWRSRLNDIHNEIQSGVDIEWDQMIYQDAHNIRPLYAQDIDKKESVRYRRHIVHLIESCIDCLDICDNRLTE